MLELEIKLKIKDVNHLLDFLKSKDAVFKYYLKHEDRYFNAPAELRDFRNTDEALRIRSVYYLSDDGGKILKKQYDITYKGPKMDKKVKTRKELIVSIDNPENMTAILTELGFRHVITLVKYRKGYSVKYDDYKIDLVIDEVKELDGVYMEAEIMATENDDLSKIKSVLLKFISELGYGEEDCITESYLELVLDKKGLL